MKNLHQKSALVDKETIKKLNTLFNDVWCKETAHPKFQPRWSEKNKAVGQCGSTALIINDLFGGKMILDDINTHVWNVLPDGSQQDFTRSQFEKDLPLSVQKYRTKEELIAESKTGQLERYKLLKKKLIKAGLKFPNSK